MSRETDVSEFVRGQQACSVGEPCPCDASRDFVRGFNAQYQLEQINENRTRGQ